MIGADAVDPGIDVVGIDIEARIEFGTGRGDALGFPGQASLPLGLGFWVGSIGTIAWARGIVHASNVVLAAGNRQHGAVGPPRSATGATGLRQTSATGTPRQGEPYGPMHRW